MYTLRHVSKSGQNLAGPNQRTSDTISTPYRDILNPLLRRNGRLHSRAVLGGTKVCRDQQLGMPAVASLTRAKPTSAGSQHALRAAAVQSHMGISAVGRMEA